MGDDAAATASAPQDSPRDSFDSIAADLVALRLDQGQPSYETIAQRVTAIREARGLAHHAARIARTTVYDAFRIGRRRLNPELVVDIVLALGATAEEAESWRGRCVSVLREEAQAPRPPSPPGPVVEPAQAEPASPSRAAAFVRRLPRPIVIVGTVVLGIAYNMAAHGIVVFLGLPLYFDMVGTAVVAIAIGPWAGAATGALSNVLGVAINGLTSLPFALVQIVGALVWGYGVRSWGLGRTLPRFLLLNVLVALACSAVAVPILIALYGGFVGHGSEHLTVRLMALGEALWMAVGSSNLLTSLIDKLLAGFMALVVVAAAAPALGRPSGVQLPTR